MKNHLLLIAAFMLLYRLAPDNLFAQSDSVQAGTAAHTPVPAATPVQPKEVRLLPFNAESIPDTYFSEDLNTAKHLLNEQNPDKASSIITKNIKNTTKRSPLQKAYILEGLLNFNSSSYKEAVKSYDNYLKLHASNSDVLYLKAQALIKSGKTEDAMNCLLEALWFNKYIFTSPAESNLQISNIYLSVDNKLKANEFMQKALTAKSDSVPVLYQLAELELSEGKKAEAVTRLRTALSIEPQNTDCRLLLARALLTNVNRANDQKLLAEASGISREIAEQAQDPEKIQEAAWLYIKASIEENKLDDATGLINQYLKKFPDNTSLQALNRQLQIELEGAKVQNSSQTATVKVN